MNHRNDSLTNRVANYLRQGNRISQRDAVNLFGAWRLGGIVHRLRKNDGMNIVTDLVPNGNGSEHAVYYLELPK